VHFETSLDLFITKDLVENSDFDYFLPFGSQLRTKFARMLLFATQICHIVVFVEPSSTFDSSYLSMFKALKIIREKYVLKFLPKLLKNTSAGSFLGKEARLCSPRFIFLFEKLGRPAAELTSHCIEMEDSIYQMLRTNFIITNNAQLSLFSIPKNKPFLFINTDEKINSDPIADSLDLLLKYIDGGPEQDFQYKPYRGYGVQYALDEKTRDFDDLKKQTFLNLLNDHAEEALHHGFDDSISKYRGKNHFARPNLKVWFETFKIMHTIFVENPKNPSFEPKDPDYVS
jgi:protein SMG8